MENYPYYIYPDIMKFRAGDCTEEEKRFLCRRIAANIGDVASVRVILGIDPEEFASFYPDLEQKTPNTTDTIDSFLNIYAGGRKEDAPSGAIADILQDEPVEVKEKNLQDAAEEIKKQNYRGALQIITDLSLKNPEKNIYFADQIRFLKKLIYNQERLTGEKD